MKPPSSAKETAVTMHAFLKMIQACASVIGERCLFKLFDLDLPTTTPNELIVEIDGSRYLRLDCLRDNLEN
jgi:hypothetical protein